MKVIFGGNFSGSILGAVFEGQFLGNCWRPFFRGNCVSFFRDHIQGDFFGIFFLFLQKKFNFWGNIYVEKNTSERKVETKRFWKQSFKRIKTYLKVFFRHIYQKKKKSQFLIVNIFGPMHYYILSAPPPRTGSSLKIHFSIPNNHTDMKFFVYDPKTSKNK